MTTSEVHTRLRDRYLRAVNGSTVSIHEIVVPLSDIETILAELREGARLRRQVELLGQIADAQSVGLAKDVDALESALASARGIIEQVAKGDLFDEDETPDGDVYCVLQCRALSWLKSNGGPTDGRD